MAVPYTFGSATSSIPLSQLDSNFATAITLGNTAVQLGNTITSLTGVSNVASATSLSLGSNGNTTAVTIDTSQNVLVGTTTSYSSEKVTINQSTSSLGLSVRSGGSALGNYESSDQNHNAYWTFGRDNASTGNFIFAYNGSQKAAIDTSGNLLVGTTATASYMDGRIIASATSTNPALTVKSFDATQFCSSMWVAATTGTNIFANFLTETTATIRGSITYNRAGGLVVYNTTSDYRAKTVNGLVENALAKVALLKPSTGRMNGATEDIDFFVAHELQEVVPSAVTGEKDAVNEDSTPKYQMVDKSALIPLLTKAIQELKAINDTQAETINALTARVVALEAK